MTSLTDEKGRKFFKWVENTVGKGEFARFEQCFFYHSVFKRLILQTRRNQGLFWKGLRLRRLSFLKTILVVAPHERRHYIFIRFCEVPMGAAKLFAGSWLACPKTSLSLGSSHAFVRYFIDHK